MPGHTYSVDCHTYSAAVASAVGNRRVRYHKDLADLVAEGNRLVAYHTLVAAAVEARAASERCRRLAGQSLAPAFPSDLASAAVAAATCPALVAAYPALAAVACLAAAAVACPSAYWQHVASRSPDGHWRRAAGHTLAAAAVACHNLLLVEEAVAFPFAVVASAAAASERSPRAAGHILAAAADHSLPHRFPISSSNQIDSNFGYIIPGAG